MRTKKRDKEKERERERERDNKGKNNSNKKSLLGEGMNQRRQTEVSNNV